MPMKAALALAVTLALAVNTAPARAGDPAKGQKEFAKCRACHMIEAPDGTVIEKGTRTGPNLWGVIGRRAGSQAGFAYGPSLAAVGAAGLVWTEEELAAYVRDPAAWLKDKTGDPAARTKMTFKLARGGEDVAAYLASVAPAP